MWYTCVMDTLHTYVLHTHFLHVVFTHSLYCYCNSSSLIGALFSRFIMFHLHLLSHVSSVGRSKLLFW